MQVFDIQIKYIRIFSFIPIWIYIFWYERNIKELDIPSKIRKHDKIRIPIILIVTVCLTIGEILKIIF